MPAAPARRRQHTPSGPLTEARLEKEAFKVMGRTRTILPLQLHPRLPAGTLVLLQPTVRSLLGDNPILQEVQTDRSLSVLVDNLETVEQELPPEALVGSVQEVTSAPSDLDPDTSPPPAVATHEEFDVLPQNNKIKWLVKQFRLDSSPLLQRDSRLRKEVIRTLFQFADVISIGGYRETNLISHAIVVEPGTALIKMKHCPLNPVVEESLRQDRSTAGWSNGWSRKLTPHGLSPSSLCQRRTGRRFAGPWIIGGWMPSPRRTHFRCLTSRTTCPAFSRKISPEKAQLFQDHIKYLGHQVSAQGISIPPEYTSVIKE